MTSIIGVFRKSTRPKAPGECPTYKEAKVANTLNIFDIGGGIRANELVVEEIDDEGKTDTPSQ